MFSQVVRSFYKGFKSPIATLSKSNHLSFSSVSKVLTRESISPRVLSAEYAVRGELVIKYVDICFRVTDRANQLTQILAESKAKKTKHNLPFNEIVFCNIGNPQSLGQQPLTFYRQVLSLIEYPALISDPNIQKLFPSDVIARAKRAIAETPSGVGAYTHSQGLSWVRNSIAEFISKRDGFPSNPDDIFIHNGASPAVQDGLRISIGNNNDGIMIPIPQYPLYSASISLLGGAQVGYYLEEEKNWGLSLKELERSYKEAKSKGINPKALVIINPGNPTGQVLTEENMRNVVEFCSKHRVVLMADEVYQENVYIKENRPFTSFKKIVRSMKSDIELFSFQSISKGFTGECGHRCGYVELVNVDEKVKAELYKLASIQLCPNTAGQILMETMVNPPKEGDPSYALYKAERDAILNSLKRRAQKLVKFLNTLEGVTCNPAEGAMYAFPQIRLPKAVIEAANKANKRPDDFYCFALLEATGVCVVPGSGFGQRDGTYHFRTTFLPPEDQIDGVLSKVQKFHEEFLKKYK